MSKCITGGAGRSQKEAVAKLQACTGSHPLKASVAQHMLQSSCSLVPFDLQATKENSGLGANLKQQPGNKNPSKGSIVDESGQAGGGCGSCVLPPNVQLTGRCLATTFELTLCCLPAEAMAPGGLVPEVTNGE